MEARNKLIIAFFVDTGIRLSELINLETNQIEDSVIKILGKGRKWRFVPISPQLRKLIVRYQRMRDKYFQRIETQYNNCVSKIAGHENISITNRYLQGLQTDRIIEIASTKSPIGFVKRRR